MRKGIRTIAFILALSMIISWACVSYAELDFTLKTGDVNCDGKVNTGDVSYLLRTYSTNGSLPFYSSIAADINGDNNINTGDAAIILSAIANNNDAIHDIEVIGNVNEPVNFTDIDYPLVSTCYNAEVKFSEYTAQAVTLPGNNISFGEGISVNLKADTAYVFETSILNTNFDTIMYLMDSHDNVFLYDDNGGDSKFSRIEFYAWEKGTYKLLVAGKNINQIGSCVLSVSEHIFIKPTPTPTAKPTSTVKPTATPTQKPTPTPTKVPDLIGEFAGFINETVPENGSVVQYKSSYDLKGIISAKKPITKVRVVITNNDGDTEVSYSKTYSSNDGIERLSLTEGGSASVNNSVSFADLTFGTKRIKIYCKTVGEDEEEIYNSRFYVGTTDKYLSGNSYSSDSALSSSARHLIAEHINSLDETKPTTLVIMEAVTCLGTPYGTDDGQLDCSALTKYCYAKAGITLPRRSDEQAKFCVNKNGRISSSDRKIGDLIFYEKTHCSCGRYDEVHHVALYIGKVNGQPYLIDASSSKHKTVLRYVWGESEDSTWHLIYYGRPY